MIVEESPRPRERRYSARWETDKVLWWRLRSGRRPRCARVVQRSLTSLVFISHDESPPPPTGAMIHPCDNQNAERHGFRVGVVRRIEQGNSGELVYVEILS